MAGKADEFAPWLGVFETLRVIDGKPLFVAEHAAELRRSMAALGLNADFTSLPVHEKLPQVSGRWRWMVTAREKSTMFTREEAPEPQPMELSVSSVRVGSMNWDARFKTISYLSHAQAVRIAETPEVVLLNENGEVASGARGNIFWRRGGRLFTPAHEAGCRCGVVRGFVLAQAKVEAGHFPLGDLLEADEIFLTNSIRGIVSVNRVEKRPVPSADTADSLRKAYDAEIARQLQ
jgi:4-amino-4-deoxychorismate lyase